MISTHFTALSGPLARSEGRRGVAHLKAFATLAERAGARGLRLGSGRELAVLDPLLDD